MANRRPSNQNGVPNGANPGPQHSAAQDSSFSRPFTLYEALPYTPFTSASIVPLESDIIPTPTLGSGSLASSLAQVVPRQDYDTLSKEAANRSKSQQLEQALDQVQQYLNPSRITNFVFNTSPKVASTNGTSPSIAAGLPPFSKMVYDNTAISFRYPTPDTPATVLPNQPSVSSAQAKQATPRQHPQRTPDLKKPSPGTVNAQSHAHNSSRFEIILPHGTPVDASTAGSSAEPTPFPDSKPVARSVTSTPRKSFAIELPSKPSFNKEDYVVVTDVPDLPEEPANLSTRKRKRDEYADSQDAYNISLDQRQRTAAAFQELRRCCQELFEAEDELSAAGSGTHPLVTLSHDQKPTLTAAAHHKLQPLLQKSISLGCFADVPLDDLLRIQRLCEGAVRYLEDLDLRIDQSSGSSEVDQWLQQLHDVDCALRAARTSFWIMSGGREDKQLYSEDTSQNYAKLLRNVMDAIIEPITEMRSSKDHGEAETAFRLLAPHKKTIATVFTSYQRLLSVTASLVSTIELPEMVINMLESVASHLIFIENARMEKDSVMGIPKFDGIRLVAMDLLSQIFLRDPSQRKSIINDILSSLDRLGKQNARQFKLADGGSIQVVSALIMGLIQASATKLDDRKGNRSKLMQSVEGDSAEEDGDDPMSKGNSHTDTSTIKSEEHAAAQHSVAVSELRSFSEPLVKTAIANASYVVNFIVDRASKSTKSGETPYRNLFDQFIEDFTTCLDLPEWPAAELLLRVLAGVMIKLSENDKTAAPVKNMALDALGAMGASISKLRSHLRKSSTSLEAAEQNELGVFLADLASSSLESRLGREAVITWSGPYRVALEYLEDRRSEDPHIGSAVSLLMAEWAEQIFTSYDDCKDDDDGRDQELGKLAYRLRMMIQDRRWLSREYTFSAVSSSQGRLSYGIALMHTTFCEAFPRILGILLRSMASDQATVRSKSLKSVNQVLETDPTILDADPTTIQLILQCSSDPSPQVRDSALGLIGKCIDLRPALQETTIPTILERFTDAGVGVRKRAMKLAKEIYLRNPKKSVRGAIASNLLHRVQDPDEGVRDIARQVIEEIWIHPFLSGEGSAAYQTALMDHVSLMVHTAKQGSAMAVLDQVFQAIIRPETKTTGETFRVCKTLVASMFEFLENQDSDDPSVPSGRDALQLLMIFAKADGRLFTFEQIRLLKQYILSIRTGGNPSVSRAVLTIYRQVLPQLSSVHSQFLMDIRAELLPSVSKVPRPLLDDVMACLWNISGLLQTSEHLARLILSSLQGVQKIRAMAQKAPLDDHKMRQFDRYSLIVGMAGKHCDLEQHQELFRTGFPKWQGNSVSKLMVDVLIPFASPSQPLEVRKSALDAVGLICQSWPRNYTAANVYTTFQQVFDEKIPALEAMVLRSFKEFLLTEEHRSERAAEAASAEESEGDKQKLTVMGGTSYDDVASGTTQRFLKEITRISLATQDEHAFLAAEVLASINRQGLVHPKETGVTLITLETSTVSKMAELAFSEHRALHTKYEAVLEREYARAIQSAFAYQRDIVGEAHGATTDPFTPKLHFMMEVLKISKSKNRSKFLEKLCNQIEFDPSKLNASEDIPPHVQYSRFIVENLAFFEYMTMGELQSVVSAMEKLVGGIGASIAHAIESEVFQVRMDAEPSSQQVMESGGDQPPPFTIGVDTPRLRQLTAGSMILQALWETRSYLRRLYNMGTSRREPKAKAVAKDLNKAPVKVQGITGDKLWEEINLIMSGLTSQEQMVLQCKSFVELMSVDKEFKVADEDGDLNDEEPMTPSGDEDDLAEDRGRKRKSVSTPRGRKKRARSSSQPRKRGRPRKNAAPDLDAEGESDYGDYFD
ncbi:Sister chromatid cohesion protein [Pleurostoma richardsiae]|uniref:Sister chromatid cohesion protein n=1 Tax=Pleurostoma richardsiae TaxID=41990 RepID=A0AA38VK81_9PEZI|nr:Sister chromatid cohesion protein [Pleurostoma richardsiae]